MLLRQVIIEKLMGHCYYYYYDDEDNRKKKSSLSISSAASVSRWQTKLVATVTAITSKPFTMMIIGKLLTLE